MKKATCNVSVLPIRTSQEPHSMMVSQMLFGESCSVVEVQGDFAKIITSFDEIEGWVWGHSLDQFNKDETKKVVDRSFGYINTSRGKMLLSIGSELDYEQSNESEKSLQEKIETTAKEFLNIPELLGGRSFFGVDASAFVQLVYKAHGIVLPRWANLQAEKGYPLAFVEESEIGDLAFFDDEKGEINHCGIMLNNSKIIHCYGKVRIDSLDTTGVYNVERSRHTHKLRFIKRIL